MAWWNFCRASAVHETSNFTWPSSSLPMTGVTAVIRVAGPRNAPTIAMCRMVLPPCACEKTRTFDGMRDCSTCRWTPPLAVMRSSRVSSR